jgi:protein involved in polysaccharide export with SLBB domain
MSRHLHAHAARVATFLLCLVVLLGGATGARAQQVSGVSQAEILERLRDSGMTRAQARQRLSQLGYDPNLADAYFNQIEGLGGAAPNDAQFAQALADMGLLTPGVPGQAGSRAVSGGPQYVVDPYVPPDTLPRDSSGVFGRDVFARSRTQFDPILTGPADPDYTIGPGDEIQLVITGDLQNAFTLVVSREGFVIIPDVGQVNVTGLTLEALRNRLYDRLGRVYSGLRRGASATTFFDVSLGRLRTIQVFVIGDVERPAAYQVSAAATVFHALNRAGGPTDLGSFRNIMVRRGPEGAVAARIDLYDYLLRGDASRDVRLNQGDLVFVPPAGAQVSVQGKVRRPGIYEVSAGEGVRDALGFAGGLEADASVQRVQIDRVLPAAERGPGVDRVVVDVELSQLVDPTASVPLHDGDEVRVFATLAERRNRVTLTGGVFRPGLYGFRPGMTVWSLIDLAGGLAETSFRQLAHVIRLVPETGGERLLRLSLETNAQGRRAQDLELQDRDSVVVFATDSLLVDEFVTVEGMVKQPGRYRLAAGMTVEDLILAAGGFVEGANTSAAEVARLNPSAQRGDTVAIPTSVRLAGAVPDPSDLVQRANGLAIDGMPQASQFVLRHEDRVFVRRMPGFVVAQTVTVAGEVMYPGPYAIQRRDERLSSLLARAGGVTEEGYVPGAHLIRDSVRVGIDLEEARDNPGREQDVILEPGDQLIVPAYDGTVLVRGAVAYESRVIYRRGRSLGDYLDEAGGTLPEADLARVSIQYPSGQRATAHRTLWWRSYPDVEPGSTITVPAKAARPGTPWGVVITTSATALSAIATLLLAINAVR